MDRVYIGIDLGGTKIFVAAITSEGEILQREMILTLAERPWQEVADDMVNGVREVLSKINSGIENVGGVGIGCPGAISKDKKVVREVANLKWSFVPLVEYISTELGVPVKLENDGNLGALGVNRFGEGNNADVLIGIFVGTGIGGGLVINGKVYDGVDGSAGEVGHMVVQLDGPLCGCGARGCWEAVAARLALYRAMEEYCKSPAGQVKAAQNYLRAENKAKALIEGCEMGDEGVIKIVHEAGRVLGIGVASLLNLFNPDVIALGGGVIEDLSPWIMPPLMKSAEETAMTAAFKCVKIVETKLQNNAILLGGAALVMPED